MRAKGRRLSLARLLLKRGWQSGIAARKRRVGLQARRSGRSMKGLQYGAMLGLVLLAFTFLGDGLRDALDPLMES